MAYIGNNPKWNTGTFTPQSSDPSNPVDGQVFMSDGTPRAEGLWRYDAGTVSWVQVGVSSSVPNKNYLLNSDFTIWQRGVSFSNNDLYTADRWRARSSSSSYTITRETSLITDKQYGLKVVSNTSQTYYQIGQQIEYRDFQHLVGKTVTFKIAAQANNANTASTNINFRVYTLGAEDTSIVWGAGGASNSHSDVLVISNSSVTEDSSSFTIPTGTKAMFIQYGNDSNSPVSGDGFQIEWAMLYEGSNDQEFVTSSNNSYIEELEKCKRFYREVGHGMNGGAYSTTQVHLAAQFTNRMRTTPTLSQLGNITVWEPSSATFTQSSTSIVSSSADNTGFSILLGNFSGMTAFRPIPYFASSVIACTSEF